MNKKGKVSVFFLAILTVLFLCLALIASYLLKQETDRRVTAEKNLTQVTATKVDLESQYSDAKKQLFLLQEKVKEAELKIKTLTSDLDAAKSQQDSLTAENSGLRESLTKEQTEKSDLSSKVSQAQAELKALKDKLSALEKEKANLAVAPAAPSAGEVALGKIVVNADPAQLPAGSILTINKEFQFVVTNLGQQDAVVPDQILTVTRDNQPVGELKIQRVQGGLSVADPVPPLKVDALKVGDRVAAKK